MATIETVEVEFLSPETAIVTVAGEHDLSTHERIASALAAARTARNIIVDFSTCTFADTSVITTVLRARHDQKGAHGEFAIVVAPGTVRRAMELIGVDRFMRLHATRGDALENVTRPRRLRLGAISETIDTLHEGRDVRQADRLG